MLKDDASVDFLQTHVKLVESAYLASPMALAAASSDADDLGGVKNVYASDALLGYAGTFSEEVLDQIRSDPMVSFVEQDSVVTTMEVERGAPWVRLWLAS